MRRISDPLLFGLCLTATLLGLLVVFDAGYARALAKDGGMVPREFMMQALFMAVSVPLGFFLGGIRPNRWERAARPIWVATLTTLGAVLVVGVSQNGARRWLGVGQASLQPAEFAKLAAILYLAACLRGRKSWQEVRKPWRDGPTWLDNVAVPKFVRWWPFATVLLAAALIEVEPDLGTAAILATTAFLIFLPGRVSKGSLVIGVVGVAFLGTFLVCKEPYRIQRFLDHPHRWESGVADDGGYQTTQSEQGIADGGGHRGRDRSRKGEVFPPCHNDRLHPRDGRRGDGTLGKPRRSRSLGHDRDAALRLGGEGPHGVRPSRSLRDLCLVRGPDLYELHDGERLPSRDRDSSAVLLLRRLVAARPLGGGRRRAVRRPRGRAGANARPPFRSHAPGSTFRFDAGGTGAVRLVLTGGGTGGHIYPAIEVGRLMAERGAALRYLGSRRGQEGAACARVGIPYEGFGSEPLWSLRTPKGWRAVARLARATREAKISLRTDRPDAVFSTGGYSAAPILAAARSLGVPYVVHEGNSMPGRTTRMFAPAAAAVGCTFRTTQARLPRAIRTGHPIRAELRAAAAHRRETPLVVVVGGSQGARFLNEGVPFAARGIDGLSWLHATGRAQYDEFRDRAFTDYEIVPYIEADRLAEAYAHARLAVGRSGSTLAEFAAFRLPSVLVPLPASADDHQRLNAREFESMGAAIVVEQAGGDLAGAIRSWTEDDIRRERARRALAEWDVPDATARLADIIERSVRRDA